MDQVRAPTSFVAQPSVSMESSDKLFGVSTNIIIIVLVIIIGLQLLGINIFIYIGDLFNTLMGIFGPFFKQILSLFGYTAGTVIEKTAGAAGTVAKTGIDITEDSLQSVGNVLKDASRDNIIHAAPPKMHTTFNASSATDPVQRPMTSGKAGWCLVGEYEGKRGCVQVDEQDKCLSGQVFPSQVTCMDPSKFHDTK